MKEQWSAQGRSTHEIDFEGESAPACGPGPGVSW